MNAVISWVLLAFLPPGHERPPVMVIERFETQGACLDVLDIFPHTTPIEFDCLPSQTIRTAAASDLENQK
ncbi:hypothetical protein [Achromobacter sp. PAB15]|uniref:hypothetical protein n=1 Tax=Achromobacter sp. PAB15 TaxID=3233048 RepID=UPI003F8F16C2